MAQSTHKVVHPESTYDVIELIGTSTKSWEDAAKNAIEEAGKQLRELRVAEVMEKDVVIRSGKVRTLGKSILNQIRTSAAAPRLCDHNSLASGFLSMWQSPLSRRSVRGGI